ncbi:hypothetical protein NHX12_012912, partial [Muraenolepis orangiensis]
MTNSPEYGLDTQRVSKPYSGLLVMELRRRGGGEEEERRRRGGGEDEVSVPHREASMREEPSYRLVSPKVNALITPHFLSNFVG